MRPVSSTHDSSLPFNLEDFFSRIRINDEPTPHADVILAFDEPRPMDVSISEPRDEQTQPQPPRSGFIRV